MAHVEPGNTLRESLGDLLAGESLAINLLQVVSKERERDGGRVREGLTSMAVSMSFLWMPTATLINMC